MYNQFCLRKDPCRLMPDPSFLFLTDRHREALSGLSYAILQRSGFAVLTGEVGTGKTTLIARMLKFIPASRLQFSKIVVPTLTPPEFLEMVLLEFGLTYVPSSKLQRLWILRKLVLDGRREGKVSALVVDEAHKLSPEVLEEIRMLANFEEGEQPFLQILLVGQTELDDLINSREMRPLKQRIGVRFSLGPLNHSEVNEYIRHRWLIAGGTDFPFTTEAVEAIAFASSRIPRVINSVCDNAMSVASAEKSSWIRHGHVRQAAAILGLPAPAVVEAPVSVAPPHIVVPAPKISLWHRWAEQARKKVLS